MVDSRKLLTQISNAGRTDFKVKKKIPKAAEIDENFEIPEINMDRGGNTTSVIGVVSRVLVLQT